MNEQEPIFEDVPDAVVKTGKRFSIVWVVPVVAALIGGWLAYKALSEKGSFISDKEGIREIKDAAYRKGIYRYS